MLNDFILSLKSARANGWLLVVIGLLSLYLPTYWDLANSIWKTDDQFHGVIILFIVFWLLLRSDSGLWDLPTNPNNLLGGLVLGLGLIFYIVGRSQEILIFEVGSQIPVFAGVFLLMLGKHSLKQVWFPLIYIAFMVPLPGSVVDSLTGPLKQWVSYGVEHILYQFGYPIARQGVLLMIGYYQLLIADACSGLNSMFSLSALGFLFIYLTGKNNKIYNVVMVCSILPIAFVANIIRVMALVLITFYWGDEAGQGFMHGFAGMVLFGVALVCLFTLDIFLSWLLRGKA